MRFPLGNRSSDALHAGRPHDERGAANVVVRGNVSDAQRKEGDEEEDEGDHRRASTPPHAGG